MAETTWPDPSTTPARLVTDIQYEKLFQFLGDGLWGTPLSPATYGDSTGRQVKIKANTRALIKGRIYDSGTTDVTKTITANTSGSTRLDLLVLQLDRATWRITSVVKAGTPGSSTPPSVQRDTDDAATGTGKFELPLAQITVANNAATIAAGDVRPLAFYIGLPELWTTVDAHNFVTATRGQIINEMDVGTRYVSDNTYKLIPDVDVATRMVASQMAIGGANVYNNGTAFATFATISYSCVAGRAYEIVYDGSAWTSDGRAPLGIAMRMYEGSNFIADSGVVTLPYATAVPIHLSAPFVAPTTGSRTFTMQTGRMSGTAAFDVKGNRQNPSWFRVLDYGTLAL